MIAIASDAGALLYDLNNPVHAVLALGTAPIKVALNSTGTLLASASYEDGR